ncbi:MAG: helix-turn-helix domain-containing protein [Candidatus Cohnella colombiensis]|uniref:Helix-turn-helix domain-containing protein n=1 Tax=Candidatus Cohnella colombiensis TaxID=3121368 RepID=A0AA95F0R5_9BACL|nr:MAG: helix-turn-helix domain-containing protein [Cohnella sp.]
MTVMNAFPAQSKAYPFPITQLLDMTEAKEDSIQRVQRTMVVKWTEELSPSFQDRGVVQFAVLNVLEDLIGKTGTVFHIGDRSFGIVLYGSKKELTDEAMDTFVIFLSSCLAKYAKIHAMIGIGEMMDTFLDLNKSLIMALQSLDHRYKTNEPESHPFVEEAKSLLQQDYGDGVCLKLIAKKLYVNPAYLGRLFKTYQAITFNEYLIQVRMEKAKELLKTTDMKIYEIAHEIGYRQLDWFYKKFKEYTGYSAKEYKVKQV